MIVFLTLNKYIINFVLGKQKKVFYIPENGFFLVQIIFQKNKNLNFLQKTLLAMTFFQHKSKFAIHFVWAKSRHLFTEEHSR